MNKKAFTLAELMGVIVIIGIIAIVVTTTVDKNIKNSRYETCTVQEKNIIEGAKTWSIDNPQKLPTKGQTTTIKFEELKTNNYIEEDLKSPMTNEIYTNGTIEIYSSNGTNYEYKVIYGNNKENCTK